MYVRNIMHNQCGANKHEMNMGLTPDFLDCKRTANKLKFPLKYKYKHNIFSRIKRITVYTGSRQHQ